ncbi:MAG TPA: AAA family ATPase [Hymenobacter sp.]|jgi:energy-coupling factor transporter ATP-binding protein EcfA2
MPAKTDSPPPAYFLSLSLENVRSFGEKQTISFAREDGRPAQWTIILGDNGVGKTTVLKSLAALMPIEGRFGDNPEPAYVRKWQDLWLPVRSGRQADRADRVEESHMPLIPKRLRELPDFKTSLLSCTIRSGVKLLDVLDKEATSIPCSLDMPFKERQPVGRGWITMPAEATEAICYGYGAGRSVGNSTLAASQEFTDDTCASLFNDRADLLNPEEWFLQMEYSSLKQDQQAAKSLKQVQQALLQVLPDVTDIQIASKGHQQYLEVETPYGWVRLRDMSLGYQTLVVWLTDFASKLFIRYPDSKKPLEEPAIVLIDEIDLHLHPSWQRKLIGFLSGIFKNTQFIATAHSPLVVQAASDADANVVLLKREGDQTVVVRNLPDVRRWRIEQILSSELFDDTPPLSAQTEKDLQRRNELLLKKRLTAKEKTELEQLNAALTTQPVGTTAPERRAEDLLAQLARNLGQADILQ